MMDKRWGSGDPNQALNDTSYAAYDSHSYLMFNPNVPVNKNSYIEASCNDNRSGKSPTIVGEFSMGVPQQYAGDSDWSPQNPSNTEFYRRWFAALITSYEREFGWLYWAWKAELDYRWSYDDGVKAGVIPKDINIALQMDVCTNTSNT